MKTRARTIGICMVLVTVGSSCGRERRPADPCEFRQELKGGDLTVEVSVPPGEPCSVGRYFVEIAFRAGSAQRIEADRDGTIAGVWLEDVTGDGLADLVVATVSAGSGSYGTVDVYGRRSDRLEALEIAPLEDDGRLGYMGHDVFAVINGALLREFPIYRPDDPNAAPSGGTARFRYSFGRGRWIER